MVDYRLVMRLVVEGKSYRFISASTGVASATVSKAVRELGITTVDQLGQVSDEQIAGVVGDGRKSVSDQYVPIDLDQVLAQRTGRKKTALNVLWARYTDQPLPKGLKFYSYERFRQIVAGEVGARGLTARVIHSPGVSMQVDWAGTKMVLVDPIVGKHQKVSVFVACLPYSGMIFATACVNQRQENWHEAHRLAFEYFGGVTEVVVPDNAATATTVIAGSWPTVGESHGEVELLYSYSKTGGMGRKRQR
ncbi:hypothetical protein [Corynebacterium cystitidis]|uniref:hypothetical protein n=1 Tax=Corynebacterium cystitidis TaxID=35757 RepID=UPI00211E07AD|nr:hypothetical protein [Corynebacterium cystitidis]